MKRLLVVFVAATLLLSCESTGGGGGGKMGGLVSENCPFTGQEIQPELTLWHGSDQVGFCCKNCYEKFNQMSPEEKDAVIAKAR